MKSKTNWEKLQNLTDEEIDIRKIRNHLHLSQEKFAFYFGVSKRTFQEWEQGRRTPTGPARNFLKVVELEPQAVRRPLEK